MVLALLTTLSTIATMGLLKSPLHPYEANTPNPHAKELEAARALYLREIDNTEGWEGEGCSVFHCIHNTADRLMESGLWVYTEHGEKKDVRLEKKILDPSENGKTVVPMVS